MELIAIHTVRTYYTVDQVIRTLPVAPHSLLDYASPAHIIGTAGALVVINSRATVVYHGYAAAFALCAITKTSPGPLPIIDRA